MLLLALFISVSFPAFLSAQRVSYKDLMYDPQTNFYTVCKMADEYFKTHDKNKKGSGWNDYMRWKEANEYKFFPSGDRSNVDFYQPAKAYQTFVDNYGQAKTNNPTGWIDLGPYSANNITEGYNPGIGRVESFWVDPENANRIFMGSRSGGFWRTENGGQSWTNTTDFLIASGVNTIAVSPFNTNEVLINVRNANNGTSHGIYRSLDAGLTWTPTAFNPANLAFGGLGSNNTITTIKYHPTIENLVFAGTSKGIYRSTDNMNTWTQLYSNGNITDVAFHPTDPNYVYVFNNGSSADKNKILISSNAGVSYILSNTIDGNENARGRLDVSPQLPDNVYFASNNGVWKSTNKGTDFVFLSKPENSCQGFAVSDVDPENMIYGYVNIEASLDGGNYFFETTAWANTAPDESYTHADLRIADCVNGVFYVGTDGYLCKSEDFGLSWTRLSDGTGIREFYRAGISQSDDRVHMAGSQDNGTSILNQDGWIEWNGGDGMEAVIHPLNPNMMIGSWQYGTRNRTLDGGLSRNGISTPESGSDDADWIAPMMIDPAQHMDVYHFSSNVHKTDQFGNPNGWELIGSPGIGQIKMAAFAENNSNILVVNRDASLMLSTDKGLSFSPINAGLPNYTITGIAFNPNDDSTLVVTYGRYQSDGQKVYISHDLGASWQNITANLGNMPLRCVKIDHSAAANIYVGAEIGVYYRPMNGDTWQLYNPGLPNMAVLELEIQYGANLLKAITWGRGLWEYPLVDRADYPAIVQTIPSIPILHDQLIAKNDPQYIQSRIHYAGTLSEVFILWSTDKSNLSNRLEMLGSGTDWNSIGPLPGVPEYSDLYFRVVAIGDHQDTSMTYTFMYKVGQCNPSSQELFVNACDSYNWNGTTLTAPGVYSIGVNDAFGCPSIETLHLTLSGALNMAVTASNGVLQAAQSGASYQWLDCNNGLAPIAGATGQLFTATVSGDYAVAITKGACTDTSACVNVLLSGVQDANNLAAHVIVQPNPSNGQLAVQFDEIQRSLFWEVLSADGKLIQQQHLSNTSAFALNLDVPAGIYFLKLNNTDKTAFIKLIIE